MTAETNSWQAFNMTAEALRAVDQYVTSPEKNLVFLNEAKEMLRSAVEIDPQFLRARYFSAVVEDMLGHPKAAATELESLIATHPDFGIEADYGLAVSRFHFYEKNELGKAIDGFKKVRKTSPNDTLVMLSMAGEIRAYGMMVLHAVRGGDGTQAERFFQQASDLANDLFSRTGNKLLDTRDSDEIRWRALIGRGAGSMYMSDLAPLDSRNSKLEKAMEDFREAEGLSANNWEILCNLGSAHMRLGIVAKLRSELLRSGQEFEVSRKLLRKVTEAVRPDYGFALWEIGRSYRTEGKFEDAKAYFARAKMVAEIDRNVSDKSVVTEIQAAEAKSTELYPSK